MSHLLFLPTKQHSLTGWEKETKTQKKFEEMKKPISNSRPKNDFLTQKIPNKSEKMQESSEMTRKQQSIFENKKKQKPYLSQSAP